MSSFLLWLQLFDLQIRRTRVIEDIVCGPCCGRNRDDSISICCFSG